MFNSIRYRFITIYFLLVFISMSIVGAFIINRLESTQIDSISSQMEQTLSSIESTSEFLTDGNWEESKTEIDSTLRAWRLSQNDSIYAISSDEISPKIISSTSKNIAAGKSALYYKSIEPSLVFKALEGKSADTIIIGQTKNLNEKHMAKPVFSSDGNIKGILYMSSNLAPVYNIVEEAKIILTYATAIALLITTILGYIIAKSITEPISALTKKASAMAKGDFNQTVEVKSDDEIGNLGTMFNYLTEELKTTISQMNLEKSKLNTIFDYMAEGVIAIDRQGFLIHANPIARNILDLDSNYTRNKINLGDLNIFNINYADQNTLKGESQIEIKESFYKIKFAPYKKNDRVNLGLIVVLQDITKEHTLDNLRKEFVANVSHELKTPITTIKSYSETLLEDENLNNYTKNFLSIINRENNRMSRLVSDLLQLSNLDYSSYKFNYEEIDTYEIINQVLESLHVLIKNKNHKILLDISMDVKNILADRHGLDQVLMNVISNAIKYTDDSGTIKISASSNLFYVKIIIEDNGIGIPKEDINRIFERFYRVEKSRSRQMGGTGLGLSIAKEMTESMGGSLTLESEFNVGTKITLTLRAY
ncbi:MAG: ATP-binding protein [Peptoniphilaceae bacterium]